MPDAFFRGVAYALYLVAALLLGVLLLWAYRMVAVGGSVSAAWQMAISLGWSALAFVSVTLVGGMICFGTAMKLSNAGRDRTQRFDE